MSDYQLTVLGTEEALTAPPTHEEARHEQSCLFGFPETMAGQLALQDDDAPADGNRHVS
jgi:hypothetical protein